VIVNWHAHYQPPEEVEKQRWPSGSSPLLIDCLLEPNGIDLAVVRRRTAST
jgi:hypothetical protein